MLLYGAPGGGADSLADTLAQAWLCTRPTVDGACGECQACTSFERGRNADLLTLGPAGKSRIFKLGAIVPREPADDDYPTALKPFFRTMPIMARHKVAILRDADRMNGDAANALLKTLEEPFPHARLILTSTNVGKILPTIRSRCVNVACALPNRAEVEAQFPAVDPDLLRLAEGAPERVLAMVDHPELYKDIAALAKSLPKRRPGEALVLSEAVRGLAERLEKTNSANARAANAEVVAYLATYVARDPKADPRWVTTLAEAHRRIVGNGNATLVLDGAFARMLK